MNGIAVIGLACRFPGARNVAEFWRNLRDGVESIATLSDDDLRAAGVAPELIAHPQYVKAAALLDGIDQFDASFFGFSPREAEILDVQHRLFLECAWEALENACCDPARFSGAIGVYAGAGMNAYLLSNLLPQRDVLTAAGEFQALISNDKDYLPTRVSYKLNLRGPSVSVQTACSTSLVAIHFAAQALLSGECDVALAGGVSVRVPQRAGYLYQEGMILSPDGHCRAFDRRAAGTVPGSGVGIVVLKRVADAVADGDRIDAVLRGSAINNDGGRKVGYTAPGVDGQKAVIREALAVAGVAAEEIGFVEAHGTGTSLGDPIEFAALRDAFQSASARPRPCVIGSVKTNVGHLDTAAGVAGFIKAVLALRHGVIPPTLHFVEPNPQIDLDRAGFRINTRTEDWSSDGVPRRAGVSSFGIGGTNAHTVLEEAPARPRLTPQAGTEIVVLSARTDASLSARMATLGRSLAEQPEMALADVAWSLQTGRQAFAHRAALVGGSSVDVAGRLEHTDVERGIASQRSVVFMFPGQGAQYPGMATELYAVQPVFREAIDRCCDRLRAPLGFDLRELLLGGAGADRDERLRATAVAQPAIFAVEYALAQQLRACGIEPAALIGHSVGEYTAACVAGTLNLDDALALLAARGQMMQALPVGRMLAVSASADRLASLAGDGLSIAAVNGPEVAVASGPAHEIERLAQTCAALELECHDLQTSHAFHSAMVAPMLASFERSLAQVRLSAPAIPWVSNRTGTWISAAAATSTAYWIEHARHTVLFGDGITCVMQLPNPLLLEAGPGRTLSTLAARHPASRDAIVVSTMRHPRERSSAIDVLLRAVGRLWVSGVDVKWDAVNAERARRRVALPTYPFERQRYWIDPPQAQPTASPGGVATEHPERLPLDKWFYTPAWRSTSLPIASDPDDNSGAWLVCAHFGDPIAEGLVGRLRRDGLNAVVVTPGEAYLRENRTQFVIRPDESDDYARVLADCAADGVVVRSVAHAWACDAGIDVVEPLNHGFFSLVALARALASHDSPNIRVNVLTGGIHAIGGETRVPAIHATVLGPVLVIPRELPAIACRSIDYARPDNAAAAERLIDLLYMEVRSDAIDPVVAYRNNQRRVRTLDQLPVPDDRTQQTIREGGHYLVTGGLGGAGFVLAEHLARVAQARLTLIGRSAVGPDDERVKRLEAAGARVLYFAADVGDLDQLSAALAIARTQFGPLHGVVHAAGVAGGALVQRRTRPEMEAVFAPKIAGTLNLARVLDPANLDVFVVMSSLTGILGEAGQIDYCAAGAFLDAFAHDLRGMGHNVCCIDWDTWQQVGMAATTRMPGVLQSLREESLRLGIRNDEACTVFDRIVTAGVTQVVVSTRDPGTRADDDARAAKRLAAAAISSAPPSRHARPSLDVAFAPPRTPQEQAVCRIWEGLLGVDGIGVDDDFFELGGHSLLATQVLSRVRDRLSVRLSLATFFEHATARQLAAVIESRQLAAILADVDALSDEDAARELEQS